MNSKFYKKSTTLKGGVLNLTANKSPKSVTAQKQAPVQKRSSAAFAEKIPLIRSLILDSVKPGVIKKIYLFGSYAYGRPTKKSDIDLCVVIKNNFNRLNVNVKIAHSLYDNGIMPVDLLVYKEKSFYDIINPNSIENTILTKGMLLYG
ncbi:MAG: nucleotidyltransferase domain-containing protein [Spirochaetaceae bacterium]|jgi:predicted nucleotidyltransferase|nr:nucleotidyltransferase domain-containing protein [Spirochaetaceae bacterium]